MPKEAETTKTIELYENEDKSVQMEWERLQNEALAAQRYRLEQEIEQARAEGLISGDSSADDLFMGINWNYKWVVTGVAMLLVVGVVAVILLV